MTVQRRLGGSGRDDGLLLAASRRARRPEPDLRRALLHLRRRRRRCRVQRSLASQQSRQDGRPGGAPRPRRAALSATRGGGRWGTSRREACRKAPACGSAPGAGCGGSGGDDGPGGHEMATRAVAEWPRDPAGTPPYDSYRTEPRERPTMVPSVLPCGRSQWAHPPRSRREQACLAARASARGGPCLSQEVSEAIRCWTRTPTAAPKAATPDTVAATRSRMVNIDR